MINQAADLTPSPAHRIVHVQSPMTAAIAGGVAAGFSNASTATLVAVRANLLNGLNLVAQHLDAGTFHAIPPGKASPPSESGQLTLALLAGIDAELTVRKDSDG